MAEQDLAAFSVAFGRRIVQAVAGAKTGRGTLEQPQPQGATLWVCVQPLPPGSGAGESGTTLTAEGESFKTRVVLPPTALAYANDDGDEFDADAVGVHANPLHAPGWIGPGEWFLAQRHAEHGWVRISAGHATCAGTYRTGPARIEVSATDVRGNVVGAGGFAPVADVFCLARWSDESRRWEVFFQPC